jgi:predicted porin
MNKKLIAVAVAGACAAPAAMAQTANPVTLYGIVYMTLESVEAKGGATPIVRRTRVVDQASRFGIRGTEDLGAGLKAFFQLETQFKPDQNDSTFATRNSAVGLQGGWGSILLGRWDTPFKIATTAIDPFGDVTMGGFSAAMNGSAIRNDYQGFDRRDQNVVQYWSPTWGGFAFRLHHSVNETRTATLNPKASSASVTFTRGPIYVGYAYDEKRDNAFGAAAPGVTVLTPAKQAGHAVFGTLTFGPIKVGAAAEKFKRTGAAVALTDQKAYAANIVWTMGNSQFMYQFQKAKEGEASGAAQPDCKVNAIAYQYNFSRRTWFIAQYTKIDNNDVSWCNWGGVAFRTATQASGPQLTAGQDPRGFGVGLRHSF